MSYTIKNTGGTLNIGQLMDFDGEVVDIAANKAAIQATWKKADGTNNAAITVAENDGDDYDCKLTIAPSLLTVTGTLDPDITGNYIVGGTYNGRNYYVNTDASRHIWWDSHDSLWAITVALGRYVTDMSQWYSEIREDAPVAGEFTPDVGATGMATVALIADNVTLPLGTHTIRLESSTDAIVPRNIEVDILTEAAYNQYFEGIIIGPSTSGLFNL